MDISDFLISAHRKLESRDWAGCLRILANARPHLERLDVGDTPAGDFYPEWGFYFEDRLAALGELKDAQQLVCAQEVIALFGAPRDRELLYSQDYKPLRFALRIAHAALATDALERHALKDALRHIDACFKIKSGSGEYMDPFLHAYETRARIYLQADLVDQSKYPRRCHEALLALEKKAAANPHAVTLRDEAVQAALAGAAYQAFKSQTLLEKLRHGPPGETWAEALERYEKVRRKLGAREAGDDAVVVLPPEAEETLLDIERRTGRPIPPSLRNCYAQHGAFRVRDTEAWGSLRLYGSVPHDPRPIVQGIVDAIDDIWGGRPEFAGSFTPDERQRLNADYLCFGHCFHDDNAYSHLAFDPAGRFLSLHYHQDDWDTAQATFKGLLNESSASLSFDGLVSVCVDDLIERLAAIHDEQALEA